jgi:hypothetical protein
MVRHQTKALYVLLGLEEGFEPFRRCEERGKLHRIEQLSIPTQKLRNFFTFDLLDDQ